MSKTGEKVWWVSNQVAIGLLAIFPALSVRASADQPDAAEFSANGWHGSGWLSHGVQLNVESGKPVFDNVRDMVFSPHYAQPIRKVILETRCTANSSPTRFLTVCPYVAGTEDASHQVAFEVVENWGELTILSVDFASEDAIDAIRIGMTDSGTGNWILTRFAVIHGEKTGDEDELMRTFARQLPTPEDLTLTDLASSSFSVSASVVEDAAGYCFELTKLTGCPRTELREDFIAAPNLSSGWTFGETNNVKFSSYSGDGSTYVDKEISQDRMALKIERKNSTDPVYAEILSSEAPVGEAIRECSFWSKCSDTGSDKIRVYGRMGESEDWTLLADEHVVTKTKDRQTILLTAEQDVRRIKFVFSADGADCKSCALDSLCVVYGGDEAREFVSVQTNATPAATWQGLESGRYGYRVKALGATGGDKQFKDSSWTEEQSVDLAWADIQLSPPENLAYEVSGDKLNLSWSPVAMADHYEVTVAPADDPENPVATLTTKSASASVPVAELGDYAVTVTAVSPGGVSTASASLKDCTVSLGKVTGLAVEATAADTIAATWKAVPLAESYQAKLFRVTGEAGTVTYGWSAEDEKIVLPENWSSHDEWRGDSWESGTKTPVYFPSLSFGGAWIASGRFSGPVTKLTCQYKCGATKDREESLATTRFCIFVAGEDGVWKTEPVAWLKTTTSLQAHELTFEAGDNIRYVRFGAEGELARGTPNVALGEVTVSYGEYVRTEVESVGTTECKASYSGLDRTAKYVVVVTPQPSEGSEFEMSSAIIDLAAEYFRPVGPVSIVGCKGVYVQRFDALACVTKETDLRRVPLENWQFFYGSGEAEKLYYTSGTNSTKGGAYCYSDAERTTDSFMIGTVAVSKTGSSVGLAFVNDTGASLGAPTLTFTAVRRNEKPGEPYALEWLVTDGPWSIGTESDGWKPLPLREGEPGFSVTPENCRLAPGELIIFRWRQEKVSGGPMLGLDDVHVEFPVDRPGCMLQLR